ncbi:uncharacterized protein LOC120977831 isoform X2 [Bufo bufo]|uniref:uncharacterized protein LOC120977831 isoform X1 n=1 Tax=Bufo bufo TaxID=8384 RepID=UPI001ABEA88F|nr:uncharacterized protein LOC120977831 isoform X1 [Bufo bufo]XP_040261897.1 uncharacterized protein LOC120977831 isoform X2 [Bufo bufo]
MLGLISKQQQEADENRKLCRFLSHSSRKTMRITTTLRLIVCLFVTCARSSDSCVELKGLTIDFSQINGLWNMKAIASQETLMALNDIHYSYAKISLAEKEGTITEFSNPLKSTNRGPISFQRVYDEKETLAYKNVAQNEPWLLKFFQVHPNVLIVNRQSNEVIKTSALYVRSSSSYPESEVENFKEWIKCKEFAFLKEFNIDVDHAQKCYGIFEESTSLEATEEKLSSWHLVAKSSTFMDQHYNLRILYTARLEISEEEGDHTFKEIITAPNDNIILELKFGKSFPAGDIICMTFKTGENLLLLVIQTKRGRTLYLASRTPTVRKSVIEKFMTQTLCIENKYSYFIPGSIRKDDDEVEACSNHLEKKVPINFRESVGKWILMASAHENTKMALDDLLTSYGATDIRVVNDTVYLSHISIHGGRISHLDDIDVEEKTGHITYKDTPSGTRVAIHSVSPTCIIFSPEGRLFLNCRANQFPSIGDINQFAKYANCRNFNNILFRQPSSFLCSEMPDEIDALDLEKIVGTWKFAALASNVPAGDVQFRNETQVTVNNEEVTFITDGCVTTFQKRGNRRLEYVKGDPCAMEVRFHETLRDTGLIWVSTPRRQGIFLILFSKSDHVRPEELIRFKHFAACLSLPVIFPR